MTSPTPCAQPDLPRAPAATIGRALGRGARWLRAALWRHRTILRAALARAMWWAALAAWWTVALGLVTGGPLEIQRSVTVFAGGAIACAVVVALGRAGRLRWWGGALGSIHGMSAVLLWFVANA